MQDFIRKSHRLQPTPRSFQQCGKLPDASDARPRANAAAMKQWLANRRVKKQQRQLEQQHRQLLEAARDLQRGGDIKGFAHKTAEAEAVARQLDAITESDQPSP